MRQADRVARGAAPLETQDNLPATYFRPASRFEIAVLIVYFGLLIGVTDVFNVRLGVELLTLAVIVPALLISRQLRAFAHDWWFFLAGLIMWNLSGPIAAQSPFPAHLDFMLNLDRTMFFGHVPAVMAQTHLFHAKHLGPLEFAAAASYNLHLPEPYIAGYFLWRINRSVYLQFAAGALFLLIGGFITFILFPAIPPWMASTRYHVIHGVVNGFSLVLHQHPLPFHGTPLFYVFHFRGDSIAAFPSEHAAFPLLEFLAFWCVSKRLSIIFLLWTLWVLFVIVFLGEHWVTDAIAGWLLAIAAFGLVRRLSRA